MATLDWPALPQFRPSALKWWVSTPRSAWLAFYTGQRQSVSHLADRMRCTVWLPAVINGAQAAQREAFFAEVASAGHWLRLWHFHRPVPRGTLRNAPFVVGAVAAGARQVVLQAQPNETLLAGDLLGAAGMLMMVGAAGAVANGGGGIAVPLALPLAKALANNAPVTWAQPTADFQLDTLEPAAEYGDAWLQAPMQLDFSQVLA